jgi:hypothetical protein
MFVRVNPGGWALNASFTSTQCNQIDIDHANALDKSLAGDTLVGTVGMATSGSLAGTVASITVFSGGVCTMTGMTGLSTGVVGLSVVVSGAAASGNNGTFPITVDLSTSSLKYTNASGSAPDANNGSIHYSIATPPAAIVVNGVGAQISSQVTGGITGTAVSTIQSGAVGGFSLTGGGTDYPGFTNYLGIPVPRSLTRTLPFVPFGLLQSGWNVNSALNSGPQLVGGAAVTAQGLTFPAPYNGATLASVVVYIQVGVSHSGVPAVLPSLSVFRTAIATGVVVTLGTVDPKAFPTPGSGAAWYDGGVMQTWTYTCNQNNVIDTTQYVYNMQLIDENGANALGGNKFWGAVLNYTGISNMAPA